MACPGSGITSRTGNAGHISGTRTSATIRYRLTIDCKTRPGQARIDRLDNKAAQPFVTMDMSTTYAGQSRFVYRTFRMLDDVRILVTDSIGLQNPSQSVQWSVITSANVECKGNTAVLKKDGKSFP